MKGFIELHSTYDGKPFLLGINSIVEVQDKFVLVSDYGVKCKETYEEIITLIKQSEN